MITLQYYNEIEKAVKVSSVITDFFASSDDDSNEEKLFYSFMLEVGLPVEKWMFYVVTHEEDAFKRCFDCKPNENDRRLNPKELFYCLKPLSDENRQFILGKISDVSDGVINILSKHVEEDNFVAFSNLINETNINTSSIASICMNVKALIDFNYAMEQFYLNIDQIVQIDNEVEVLRQMEKVFNVFLSNYESFIDDEQATDQVVNYVNNLFEELSQNENLSEVVSNLTISKYHYCLWFYHHIQSVDFATRVPLDVLEEIVFNPKYEKLWNGYEDKTCLEELDKEMENFFVFSVEEGLDKHGVLIADRWPLPVDFFEPAYIDDDCPKDEYFPEFLKDLIQFEGHNEQLDDSNAKLRKEGLVKLSKKFSKFINDLASKNYIPDDDANKLALAHALTGRRVKSSVKRVNWSKPKTLDTPNGNINAICFLIKWLYPLHISDVPRKYEHILTVFEGLEGKKTSSSTGDNVKKSPIKDSVEKFLLGLVECTQIVNGEKLKLRIKKIEQQYGKD